MTASNGPATREELALQIDVARWEWLRPHHERGALVLVAPSLSLEEVGERMAADDAAAIQGWLASGQVGRAVASQIADWEETPDKPFRTLIVSPYVLIQEIGE